MRLAVGEYSDGTGGDEGKFPMGAEVVEVHTRLLKCALAVPESQAYWSRVDPEDRAPRVQQAFEQFWFGSKSQAWVEVLVANLRARYDAYPRALGVLRRWDGMGPEARALVCHWHVQLTDPLYRRFTGEYLLERRAALRPEVHRDAVMHWVVAQGLERWTMATRKQFASKALNAALTVGLVAGRRDPRPLTFPRVPDVALGYLLYLLRGLRFEGTLLDNPYLRSVGLSGGLLDERLRGLPYLRFQRMGDVVEFGFRYPDLRAFAEAELFGADGDSAIGGSEGAAAEVLS